MSAFSVVAALAVSLKSPKQGLSLLNWETMSVWLERVLT